jgi:hypothetical protein
MNEYFLIFNLTILIIINYYSLKYKLSNRLPGIVVGVFFLVWFELILTGYTLSIFHQLGNKYYYTTMSCIYAFFILLGITRFFGTDKLDKFEETKFKNGYMERLRHEHFFFIYLSLIILVVTISLFLCFYHYPNNPDSESYRLPRVYFYKGFSGLNHFTWGIDARLLFYPLNGVLAHMIVAVHEVDLKWFHLFTFSAWVINLFTAYGIAREFRYSKTSSIVSSLVLSTTPIYLSLAASGNDEVLAVSGIYAGFYFAYVWIKEKKEICWFLATIAISIAVGVKEHFVFYFLFVFILLFWIIFSKKLELVWKFIIANWEKIVTSSFLMLFSISISPIINYLNRKTVSSGLAKAIVNQPFNLFVAFQNFGIFSLQMLLTPFQELVWERYLDKRLEIYAEFENYFKIFTGWINTNQEFISPFDPFKGISHPEAAYRIETTVWLGFIPIFIVYVFFKFYRNESWKSKLNNWFIFSFFSWMFTFSAIIKFQYTIQVYFAYPLVFLTPIFAFGYQEINRKKNKSGYFFKAVVAALIVTNLYFTVLLYRDNSRRNIKNIVKLKLRQFYQDYMTPQLEVFLRKQSRVNILSTHFEMPYMHIMRRNPKATYSTGILYSTGNWNLNQQEVIFLQCYPNFSQYNILPLNILTKKTQGLTYLGKLISPYGWENVFASNNDLDDFKNKYVVLLNANKVYTANTDGTSILKLKISSVYLGGENVVDELNYSISLISREGRLLGQASSSNLFWKPIEFSGKIIDKKNDLEIYVTEGKNKKFLGKFTFPLEDGVEYEIKE